MARRLCAGALFIVAHLAAAHPPLPQAGKTGDDLAKVAHDYAVAARTGANVKEAVERLVENGTSTALDVLIREYPQVETRAVEARVGAERVQLDIGEQERRLATARKAKDENRAAILETRIQQHRRELAKLESESKARAEALDAVLAGIRSVYAVQPEAKRKEAEVRFERGFHPKTEELDRGPLITLYATLGLQGSVQKIAAALTDAVKRKRDHARALPDLLKDEERTRERVSDIEKRQQPMPKVVQDAWMKACAEVGTVRDLIHRVDLTIASCARAFSVAASAAPEGRRGKEVDDLLKTMRTFQGEERWLVLAEIGKVREKSVLEALRQMVRGKDTGLVVFGLRGLAEYGDEDLHSLVAGPLADPDWAVRAAAIHALRAVRKAAGIPILIETLAREKGRLKDDASGALRSLTGKDFHDDVALWKEWWAKEGDGFVVPAASKEGEVKLVAKSKDGSLSFYGIQSSSNHVLFVIDVSRSMTFGPDAVGQEGPPAGKPDRMAIAKEQLVSALKGLKEDGLFNIVWFSTEVGRFRKDLVPTTRENIDAAVAYVRNDLQPIAGTNVYAGIKEAFSVAGLGSSDKYYTTRIDTMFFLTDLEGFNDPTKVQGEVVDPDQLLDFVREKNRLNKIVIHTVGVGVNQTPYFLKRLAEENGGQYEAR